MKSFVPIVIVLIMGLTTKGELSYPGQCIKDTTARVFGNYIELGTASTPERCIKICREMQRDVPPPTPRKGFPYAGMQFRTQCFCGSSIPANAGAPSRECNMPCPGDKRKKCGGAYRMNVYPTGVKYPKP
eukprot:TRINITY_DN1583_c0_g1_i1.p1 TRINITY_DN1583_c0_g1~~TRINITY_DN1583_c0_g1_i1.p1  ORF type:complete len:130 (-),score=6.38 TRINITY_DN1583_c0_g1_i1:110-499(-)